MNKVEKIKAEIERLQIELIQEKEKGYGSDADDACILELQNVLTYIDSLEEEPVSNDLEKAASEYAKSKHTNLALQDIVSWDFKAGAQWQKERILNNAMEREVKVDAGGYPYIDVTELYDYDKDRPLAKEGDKVKLIIIMEG